MRKRNFVIYDTEEWYGKKLNDYIRAKCREEFEFYLFTKKEPLYEFLTTNPADILLAANLNEREADTEGIRHMIRLSDAPVADADNSAVFKYGSAEDLLRKVMRISAAENAADTTGIKKASLTGFFSPIKRCGQTTLALTMGQMTAKKKKTLYVTFEPFSGLCRKEGDANDLMDLLYYSECSSGNFAVRVSSMAEQIGELDCIPPVRLCGKYRDISKDQWIRLVKRICAETEYECVILDISEQAEGFEELLNICDRVYLIEENDRNAQNKLSLFEENMKEIGLSDVLSKMKRIRLPGYSSLPEEPELLIYSELADYVRKILVKEEQD